MPPRVERIHLTCRGVEKFGVVRYARACDRGRSDLTLKQVQGRAHPSARESDLTYVCRHCKMLSALVVTAKGLFARAEREDAAIRDGKPPGSALPEQARHEILYRADEVRTGVRSWPDVDDIVRARSRAWPPGGPAGHSLRRGSPGRTVATVAASKRRAHEAARLEGGRRQAASRLPAAMRAARWRRGVQRDFRLCLGCGRLLARYRSQLTELHRQCFATVLRGDAGRQYMSKRLALARKHVTGSEVARRLEADGVASGRFPMPTSRAHRDPAVLKRNLAWAVRHYCGGERQDDIATTAGKTRQAVTAAIGEIIDLLPPPGVGDRFIQELARTLRQARATSLA